MRSGYYHLELSQESQPKSDFVVEGLKGGKWEFKRCPFRLTQAPAYFQMLVNKVLEGLEFTFSYLNDILIYSRNMEEHLQHVQILFCTVSLSLFAGPERILRRFYIFAEEPCKSTITTSESCSPVFKEAQPRPSQHSCISQAVIQSNLNL